MTQEETPALVRVRAMQELLDHVRRDNSRVAAMLVELRAAKGRLDRLAEYYYDPEWMDDVANVVSGDGEHFEVLGQDHIFDAITDHDVNMRRLLAFATEHLVEPVPEIATTGDAP